MSILWKWVLAAILVTGAITGVYIIVQLNSSPEAADNKIHKHEGMKASADHNSRILTETEYANGNIQV
ncbi:hypothetical protein [Metabacillus sp. 84]|uniref:hypothetical protein n=2 Tax=unclassified Metabacillus TaxID=2675274 RepID=UPI003CEA1EA9